MAGYSEKKYLNQVNVNNVCRKWGDSPAWVDLLKQFYMRGRRLITSKGDKTMFWHDSWLRNEPVKDQYPVLFSICDNKDITVKGALQSNFNMEFRCWLYPELQEQ